MNRTVLVSNLMTKQRHSATAFHIHSYQLPLKEWGHYIDLMDSRENPKLSVLTETICISHVYLLFQQRISTNCFYWKSLKELLTRSFTTTISSLEEREAHVTSHTPKSIFPLPPSKGYSILRAVARQSWSSMPALPNNTLTDPVKNF